MHSSLRLPGTALAAFIICSLTSCSSYRSAPLVGAPAPEFTLLNQDSKPTHLKNYRGQWVVLYFYPKDFGDFSTRLAHGFRRDLPKFAELHTTVLGISGQGPASHKLFANREQLPFVLLSDPSQNVMEQYGSFRKEHGFLKGTVFRTFLIDPTGKVASVLNNFDTDDLNGRVLSAEAAIQQH